MDRNADFEAWAPQGGAWTPWAKPVLFAYVDAMEGLLPPRPTWLHSGLLFDGTSGGYRSNQRRETRAAIVDLPGVEGVAVGLELAEMGFRPVPLYAAVPAERSIVPMWEVVRALVAGAGQLRAKGLPLDAPPAFLLDARRDGGDRHPEPVEYDNRSVVFATDFPSDHKLRGAGIQGIILIHSANVRMSDDLRSILAHWQGRDLPIVEVRADEPRPASKIRVRKLGLFERLDRWLFVSRPRPDGHGRFGRWVPEWPQGG